MYSEADKDPAPARDRLILLWAQRTLELNLCKVEEGGRDGAENLYKYTIPWGSQCLHFKNEASLLKITSTAGGKRLDSSSVCAGEGSCVMEDRSTQGARAIVVRCSRTVTLLFSKLKKKKNRP